MTHRIEVERRAQKELSRLPKAARQRVVSAIDGLAETPRPAGCKPVRAAPPGTYRLRGGDYRLIYVVMEDDKIVVIARISRRSEQTCREL